EPGRAGRHWAFLAETLEDLRADLARCGADLVLRSGAAVAVLSQICRAYGITRILSHRGGTTAAEIARDAAVADWARGA
ncbi:deoxyribodipyrimidine photo-lyase, partial [Thioclava sp. BHET1]